MPVSHPYRDLLEACRRRPPRVALVLGSGLEAVGDRFDCEMAVSFRAIPELEPTSVEGHRGELRLGSWAGQRVLLFLGRLHFYEGHPWRSVEQQVPTARQLGADVLVLTNAAGGIRPDLIPGALMPIRAHVEWTRSYPWRLPDPPSPYSERLLALLGKAGRDIRSVAPPGVYAQVTGPCYETPAEIRALRACGADVVGMSTCREINRGHALGMECAAVSCITNRAAGLAGGSINHDEVIVEGKSACGDLASLMEGFLASL